MVENDIFNPFYMWILEISLFLFPTVHTINRFDDPKNSNVCFPAELGDKFSLDWMASNINVI